MTSPVVEAEGLSKSFGPVVAVSAFSLALSRGELLCLVGPDGAGKSTAVRMLSGILRPTSGTARIFGFNLVRETQKVRKHIGYMSQKFTLYGDLTVDENIEFFAAIHEVQRFEQRREDLLAFTRLKPFRKRLADQLSGGMKQKLSLACTLVHAPGLLLLDEPTTGVDVVSRREFWTILRDLLQTGIAILMTTPYMDEAERGTRVALMDHGSLVVVDTPDNVRRLVKNPLVEIISEDPRRAAAAMTNLGEVLDVQTFGDRLHVVMRSLEQGIPAVERRLEERGIRIRTCRPISPSLENAFIFLTQAERSGP